MTSSSDSESESELEIRGLQAFFGELGRFLTSSGRMFETSNESYSNYVIERLETIIITLNGLKETLEEASTPNVVSGSGISDYKEKVKDLLVICRTLSRRWEQQLDEIETGAGTQHAYVAPRSTSSSGRGRPRFEITREQLVYLAGMSFSWTNIASMMGVSRMTIYRRRVEYGLVVDPWIVPTDVQLHTVVRQITAEHPELGEVMIMGRIRGMGYKVTRERLRQVIRSNDPLNTALRWGGNLTSRRPYCVASPNSLWHIGKLRLSQNVQF